MARRHNRPESFPYHWLSARKVAAVAIGNLENVEFIPVGIIEGPASRSMSVAVPAALERAPEPSPPTVASADKTGAIKITLTNGTVTFRWFCLPPISHRTPLFPALSGAAMLSA